MTYSYGIKMRSMLEKYRKALFIMAAGLFLAATGASSLSASAATTEVDIYGDTANSENDKGGWLFNRDVTTSTPYTFNTNEASIGDGSLYVLPVSANPADKFIAEYFVQESITDVDSISYDFLIGGGGDSSDENEFYMNVYANFGESDPLKFYDCRYNIVPTSGSTSSFTTVEFDPTQNYPVATRGGASASPYTCPSSPADMDTVGPNANPATIRVIALNMGDTSANDTDLDGYFDNVQVAVNGSTTVFDFEPMLTPSSKDDCKKGGWATFNTPQTFKNQGECVSFMAKAKTSGYVLDSASIEGIDIATKKGTWYEVTVSGTWSNRSGELVDAECTNTNSTGWINAVLPAGAYSSDLLDVQVNESFIAWGQCDADDNTYTTWVQGDGSPMNLRVFDGNVSTNTPTAGWYGDNNGSLDVTVVAH